MPQEVQNSEEFANWHPEDKDTPPDYESTLSPEETNALRATAAEAFDQIKTSPQGWFLDEAKRHQVLASIFKLDDLDPREPLRQEMTAQMQNMESEMDPYNTWVEENSVESDFDILKTFQENNLKDEHQFTKYSIQDILEHDQDGTLLDRLATLNLPADKILAVAIDFEHFGDRRVYNPHFSMNVYESDIAAEQAKVQEVQAILTKLFQHHLLSTYPDMTSAFASVADQLLPKLSFASLNELYHNPVLIGDNELMRTKIKEHTSDSAINELRSDSFFSYQAIKPTIIALSKDTPLQNNETVSREVLATIVKNFDTNYFMGNNSATEMDFIRQHFEQNKDILQNAVTTAFIKKIESINDPYGRDFAHLFNLLSSAQKSDFLPADLTPLKNAMGNLFLNHANQIGEIFKAQRYNTEKQQLLDNLIEHGFIDRRLVGEMSLQYLNQLSQDFDELRSYFSNAYSHNYYNPKFDEISHFLNQTMPYFDSSQKEALKSSASFSGLSTDFVDKLIMGYAGGDDYALNINLHGNIGKYKGFLKNTYEILGDEQKKHLAPYYTEAGFTQKTFRDMLRPGQLGYIRSIADSFEPNLPPRTQSMLEVFAKADNQDFPDKANYFDFFPKGSLDKNDELSESFYQNLFDTDKFATLLNLSEVKLDFDRQNIFNIIKILSAKYDQQNHVSGFDRNGAQNFLSFLEKRKAQGEVSSQFFDDEGKPLPILYEKLFDGGDWNDLRRLPDVVLEPNRKYALDTYQNLTTDKNTILINAFQEIVLNLKPLAIEKIDLITQTLNKISEIGVLHPDQFSDGEKEIMAIMPDSVKKHYLNISQTPPMRALNSQPPEQIDKLQPGKDNILDFLAAFINLDANDWENRDYSQPLKDKIKAIFGENTNKDLALNTLQSYWLDYLNSNNANNFPIALEAFALHNQKNEGAGPLTQIESFLDFMLAYKGKLSTEHISDLAKQKFQEEHGRAPTAEEESELAKQKSENLFLQTKNIEERFTREKWEQAEISNFYNVSSEILNADARLYVDFIQFFNQLNKEYFKKFVTEIYPLYRAKLSLLKKYDDFSNGIGSGYSRANYSHLDFGNLRRDLRAVLETFDPQELDSEQNSNNFKDVKAKMLTEIKNTFQEKFAILPEAIPTDFTDEQIKSMENLVLYNSNIANRDQQKESLIGFYLALLLQGQGDHTGWQKLREGDINGASGLLETNQAIPLDLLIAKQKEQSFFTPEITNLQPEQIPQFIKALQVEGLPLSNDSSVQTIDLKLQNLIGNLQELTDEDYYQTPVEKCLLRLLQDVSNKDFGRVVAKLYQETNGKNIAWQEDELPIKQQIVDLFNHSEVNLSLTPDNIKKYLQDGSKVLTTTLSITQLIETSDAKTEIIALQNLLSPSEAIITIFNRLGENFQNNSGARALSTDLDNLENLIVKKENELEPDEKKLLTAYLTSIREQMSKLEKIYGQITNKFSNIKKGLHTEEQSALTGKIAEIDGIIAGTKDNQTITTRLTSDLNVIIQNMRACLSAKTKGINNDTDLTFGEPYKFYLYSHNETNKTGSISDEIVYFVPNTTTREKNEDGTETETASETKLSFVMDQLYGQKTSDVFYNHIEVLINKLQNLHRQFPDTPLSVFVTGAAMSSIGVNGELVKQKFSEHGNLSFENVNNNTVNVPASVFGDHYVEFGGTNAREAGRRSVSGLEIKIK